MLSRFNNSLLIAEMEPLDLGILDEENALDQLFNRIASENILSTRKLFRQIYQVELQVKERHQRANFHRSSIKASNDRSDASIDSLLYFQRMRKMNELALIPETPAETISRLDTLDVDYNENLEKNMQNIYENMRARNSITKESIDVYAREYKQYVLKR
jgi:hypothetical protein